MNDYEKSKIERFVADEVLCNAVFKLIRSSFLRPSVNKDVSYLAASRIAIDLLADAERELSQFKSVRPEENTSPKNVGV